MKTRFIGILLVAAFFILSFPSGAAASHSFAHIIETLQNALLEVHRMFPSPAAPSDKFRMGDRVVAQSPHNARSDPLFSSWIVVGGAPAGTKGTGIDSSRTISGSTWWNIVYDTGTFGWSQEINLAKDSAPAPIPSPAPAPIPTPTPTPPPAPAFGLRYFGYAEVDCGTNYIDEVASFTNLAHLCITLPSDTIVSRLDRFAARGVKAVINLDSIFFMSTVDRGCTPDPFQDRSCVLTTLRADYRTRWDTFVQTNQLKLQEAKIGAFWVKDEPAWNNLSVSSLAAAANIVKTDFPSVPTLAIEGWPAMDRFQMPSSIDWIGFDFYGVRNPATNVQYQYYFSILKSRRQAHQKLFIVMDGAWRASLQGSTGIFPWPGVGGLSQNDMAEVAQNYYTLAKSDLNVVGIGVLLWPSGIVTPDQIGSRDLPAAVRDQHRQIGKSITGKN